MKKLNKKGFTLIELLAVIVILAIVLVVTIPSVLRSMETARQKQFENAITSIQDYVQKNLDICNVTGSLGTTDTYDIKIITYATTGCTVSSDTKTLAEAAGYTYGDDAVNSANKGDIKLITGEVNTNKKYIISAATAASNGKFKGATYSG